MAEQSGCGVEEVATGAGSEAQVGHQQEQG
jgi:hypothetical protein